VNPLNKTPMQVIIFVFLTGAILLLIQLGSDTAFVAITSIAAIGFQLSYAIPIILRITYFRYQFQPAYFNLGNYSFVCGVISSFVLVITSCLFLLPTSYPIQAVNFNYTSAILVAFLLVMGIYWEAHGKKVFVCPK
jgi:amino acid transporter